jgi:hemerythrin
MGDAATRDHEQACRQLEDRLGGPEMPAPYVCGLAPIDREHALLIAQHRRCLAALARPDPRRLTRELASYRVILDAHDRSEELLQRELGFPELGEHALVHRHFLRNLDEVIEELRREGPSPALARWMKEDAPRWLGVHLHNDQAIARWVRAQGFVLDRREGLWRAGVPDLDGPLARGLRLIRS